MSTTISATPTKIDQARLAIPLWQQIAMVAVLHLVIGCAYSGPAFFRHFSTGVPFSATGGGVALMPPGDHFEQLNRYTMVGRNLLRGRAPYDQRLQYNISDDASSFSEGWIFFPFSFLGGLLAVPFGQIAAFNLLTLLSYPFTGVAMFVLVRRVTSNFAAGLVASIVISTIPFRTSFLYGELVFGIEICLLPLTIWAFERYLEHPGPRSAAEFGVLVLFCVTANFQAAYFFFLFGSFYFLYGAWQCSRKLGNAWPKQTLVLCAALVPAGAYLAYANALVNQSAKAVQPKSIAEVLNYTPALANIWTVYNGNEKNLYLGFPLLLLLLVVAAWGFVGIVRTSTGPQKRMWYALGPMFAASYLFCLGPSLDKILGVPIYATFFFHFPGASATRTPGRIMAVTAVFFAVLLGLAWEFVFRRSGVRPAWALVAAVAVSVGTAARYDYLAPSMALLDSSNAAYESIRGTTGRVLGLPFQFEPDHYFNATFLYYAAKYDLNMFNGHSSMYPPAASDAHNRLWSVTTSGDISESTWKWLRKNDYRYIVAHATAFEPRIEPIVLARLKASRFLEAQGEVNGIHKFAVLGSPRLPSEADSAAEFTRALRDNPELAASTPVIYQSGWYSLERYPGQRPFRWMHGTESSLLVYTGAARRVDVQFGYRCPFENFNVAVDGAPAPLASRVSEGGWRDTTVSIEPQPDLHAIIELITSRTYTSAADRRRFGCMISEVTVSQSATPEDSRGATSTLTPIR